MKLESTFAYAISYRHSESNNFAAEMRQMEPPKGAELRRCDYCPQKIVGEVLLISTAASILSFQIQSCQP